MTCRDDIIDLHTACCHFVILVDEFIVGCFPPLKAIVHSMVAGADAWLQPALQRPYICGFTED